MDNQDQYTAPAGPSQAFALFAAADVAAPGKAGARRTFTGVAYSGGAITDQCCWESVVIDVDGVKFMPERMPVLLEHDRDRAIGYTTGFDISRGQIQVSGVLLGEGASEAAAEVAAMADQGFPWQMSVHIVPDSVESVESGGEAAANGRAFRGPAKIFRKSAVREVSFCAVGADRSTSAAVFAAREKMEVAIMSDKTAAPSTAPASARVGDSDLALRTLSDEKSQYAAKCAALETEKGKLLAEAAELRAEAKQLKFELANVKGSYEKAIGENSELRLKMGEAVRATRAALLEDDCKKAGLKFEAARLAKILEADEAVFQEFRAAFAEARRGPEVPIPAGAFASMTPQDKGAGGAGSDFTAMALNARAKERRSPGAER
jgi:hypothetical protein